MAADDWWDRNATDAEKANYEWIRQHAPIYEPERQQVGHDGMTIRPGAKIPEWWYRMKYRSKKH